MIAEAARKFLAAVREAGRIYRRIAEAKSGQPPVIEVSLDETDRPQTPVELLLILAAVAEEGIPAQTIAPRFVGRFNKGVDYVGDVAEFRRQFEEDLAVVAFAVREFQLPGNLKLSVHSGSDKFAIYRPMHEALKKFDAGVHLKTAGTTWLEELIGLATAGGDGLEIAKDVYRGAWRRFDELCAPYASVVDIDRAVAALAGGCRRLGRRGFCRGVASRCRVPGLQSASPPALARRLQGGGRDGRPLHRRPGTTRRGDCRQRDPQFVRAAHPRRCSSGNRTNLDGCCAAPVPGTAGAGFRETSTVWPSLSSLRSPIVMTCSSPVTLTQES